MKQFYFVEITDTFSGDANYSWVRRYLVRAASELGAVNVISRNYRAGWRRVYSHSDNGGRYDLRGAAVCMFVEWIEANEVDDYLARYSKIDKVNF